jgi:hypothetical protein
MFDQIRQHQDKALAIMSRVSRTLSSTPPDVKALSQARWELARTLRAYQLYKHGSIFDPIIAREQGDRVTMARSMRADCIRMGEEYRLYVLKWSAVSVIDVWAEYRSAAIGIIGRLRAHLESERKGIVQLEQARGPSPVVVATARPAMCGARA